VLDLTFVPALDPGARALTVTLPDVTSLPVTGLGAVRATVPLAP
jgi:hypothetical protein